MKLLSLYLTGILSAVTMHWVHSQPATASASTVTTTNIYAQQQIDLLPGFSSTTVGFEAKIKPSEMAGGKWSAPLPWTPYQDNTVTPPIVGMVGIHTHVTPDGKVLSWQGHNDNNNSGHLSHVYTWNPNRGAQSGLDSYPNIYTHPDNDYSNIFCSGHSFLADGRLLVTGGHFSNGITKPSDIPSTASLGYIGLKDANTFNYAGSANPNTANYFWQTSVTNSSGAPANITLSAMANRRWYPTNTTMADGKVVSLSGQAYVDGNGVIIEGPPEVYNPTNNTWQVLNGAARDLPFYPWMFLAPNGQVFNAGPNADTKFLDPNFVNGTQWGKWGTTYNAPLGLHRTYGSAAMYAPGKILIFGGNTATCITRTAELIDINTPGVAQFQAAASMVIPRTHVNATILPDGTVLASGGASSTTGDDGDGVLPPELWTPPATGTTGGGTWTLMAPMAVPRMYHSTAVLLPDATVLSTGGQNTNKDHPDYEIFTPPYLCKGFNRPQITSAPQAVNYGQDFIISSPTANDIRRYGRATLVRLSSVTHSFNMNQLFIELPRLPVTAPTSYVTNFKTTAPSDPNLCPPGHYMLFLIADTGTPSFASIISITNTPVCTTTVTITQSLVSQTDCDRITRFTASSSGTGSYTWTVNGAAPAVTNPYIEVSTSTGSPTAQVSVTQSSGCSANSNLVSYFPNCATPCSNCQPLRLTPVVQPTTER